MFGAYLHRVTSSLNSVEAHLRTSQAVRDLIAEATNGRAAAIDLRVVASPPEPTEWKIIDHAAALSRIYAIYEQFVHEVVREYASFLEGAFDFANLDPKFLMAYRLGIAAIMQKADHSRYSHLSVPGIVSGYANALSGGKPYAILADAVLTHDRNLVMGELAQLLAKCGIDALEVRVSTHPSMVEFFARGNRSNSNSSSELKELVGYRNESAHGGLTIGSILGLDELLEYAEFCAVLCHCISEIVQKTVVEQSITQDRAVMFLPAKEVLKRGAVVIGTVEGEFTVGMTLYAVTQGRCVETTVTSLQVDDVDIDGLTTIAPLEIGFGLSIPVKRGCRLVRMKPAGELQFTTAGGVGG